MSCFTVGKRSHREPCRIMHIRTEAGRHSGSIHREQWLSCYKPGLPSCHCHQQKHWITGGGGGLYCDCTQINCSEPSRAPLSRDFRVDRMLLMGRLSMVPLCQICYLFCHTCLHAHKEKHPSHPCEATYPRGPGTHWPRPTHASWWKWDPRDPSVPAEPQADHSNGAKSQVLEVCCTSTQGN